jgi:hypothetical protein
MVTEQANEPRWVNLSQAARELGLQTYQVSRWAREGKLLWKFDPTNAKVRLVNVNEVRRFVEQSPLYTQKKQQSEQK